MSTLVYSKPNCPYCVKAKSLLASKGIAYEEVVIGKDMITEDFRSIFPEQKTVPLIIMNGVKYGGYDKLTEYFNGNTSTFLTEKLS